MQQLLDEISYIPEAGRNRLRLTKRVVPAD
jgi:hypothetical protein